ncbi:hypothetical protein [Arthrobacter sp. SLBN-112]|uniref:hypothetical protein n=1 Tax=Arthrobacter sp. SLBN-112 TaxID=2768452 RepID=UPI00190FB1EE|nr:hypothetical protein [Arthrobacter sp. SLBN-112]
MAPAPTWSDAGWAGSLRASGRLSPMEVPSGTAAPWAPVPATAPANCTRSVEPAERFTAHTEAASTPAAATARTTGEKVRWSGFLLPRTEFLPN